MFARASDRAWFSQTIFALGMVVFCAGVAALATPLRAQEQAATEAAPQSDILTVDTDFIFTNSLYGAKIEQDFSAAAQVLIAENTEIEAMLTAEEKTLTDERATLGSEEFRSRAQAFDARVQKLRQEQREKETEVQSIRTNGRQTFQEVLTPILTQIARERGASVMFERQTVFLSAESIDVTLEALDMVNAAFKEDQDPDAPQITAPNEAPALPDGPSLDAPTAPQEPAQDAPTSAPQD